MIKLFLVMALLTLFGTCTCRGIGQMPDEDDNSEFLLDWVLPRMLRRQSTGFPPVTMSHVLAGLLDAGINPDILDSQLYTSEYSQEQGHTDTTEMDERNGKSGSKEKPQETILPWEMKYFSPMLRGKKSHGGLTRSAMGVENDDSELFLDWIIPEILRSSKRDTSAEKPTEVKLPWEMKYFSPMLRGKKSYASPIRNRMLIDGYGKNMLERILSSFMMA